MCSKDVLRLRQGHANVAKAADYRKKSAKPWTREDVEATLAQLQLEAEGSEGMTKVIAIRNGTMLALLQETQSRGANAGA